MQRFTSGSEFEGRIGYSRSVLCDGWVFVSGTTGYDYATMTLPEGIEAQCRQALANLETALKFAGSNMAHVVRVTYMLPDRGNFPACWPLLRAAWGDAAPAATMIECGLMEPQMRIEIEATARAL
ncbi:enamine deaminase RidA (YjgF/YER057c/UK114 family) [Limimaricola soesokkakensis]|uniref:Enamine deaminase RidA (YjgF/YER057c/UK114 family) n=1 Tax=Limimaricola soesokkakensis TaxID=1343159 RepID=A0A1X6YGQ0_9RHOB|nr:RidA family protein [Limimaricola soesokkakensis]PSK82141.1 enamine deaminase RidA (YjgF/YER057c/UK114 family) [Limimaricola soesokkakensis]SLN20110.1 Putative aminoacrylate peracid reductase RutC [Limimaricola soesokkakensis]